jgi:hypothetical protein
VELNPNFDMKYFNAIQQIHNIDFFYLSMNSAITLNVLDTYPDLPWNATSLYLNPNFRNTQLAKTIQTDINSLFKKFKNITYNNDAFISLINNPQKYINDTDMYMSIHFSAISSRMFNNTFNNNIIYHIDYILKIYPSIKKLYYSSNIQHITINQALQSLILIQDVRLNLDQDTFISNYEKVLKELDEIHYIPPNIPKTCIF